MIGPLVIIIMMVLVFYLMKRDFGSSFDIGAGFFALFGGAMFGGMFSLLIVLATIPFDKKTDWIDTGSIPIVSIQPKDEINGSFCLGSGYIGTTQYYFAMKKLSEDSYRPIKIDVDDVLSIDESNKYEPCFEVYKKQTYNNITPYIFWFADKVQRKDYAYRVIVPKGTVIKEYRVQ